MFFSLSVQIFFLFIQFSLSNFLDRSSSVSHFWRRNRQRITFHSPAIQVILLLYEDVGFFFSLSRAMAGSQNTHKIIHSAPELGHNLAPASAASIIHSSVPPGCEPSPSAAHTCSQACTGERPRSALVPGEGGALDPELLGSWVAPSADKHPNSCRSLP